MTENSDYPMIRDPENELREVYEARVRPFVDLGHAEKTARYEEAWQIARSRLRQVREQKEDHAD